MIGRATAAPAEPSVPGNDTRIGSIAAAVEHAVISGVRSTSFYDCVTVLIALFICPADDTYPGRGRGGDGVLAMGMGRRDDRKQ